MYIVYRYISIVQATSESTILLIRTMGTFDFRPLVNDTSDERAATIDMTCANELRDSFVYFQCILKIC